jgi:transposase
MCKTVTVPSNCCAGRDECFLSSSASLPMADTQARRCAWRTGTWRLQIVKRSDAAGFEVLPKRWIVERTFAWISRNRRLARDFERYATTVAAFVRLAMIRIMLRRLAATASS